MKLDIYSVHVLKTSSTKSTTVIYSISRSKEYTVESRSPSGSYSISVTTKPATNISLINNAIKYCCYESLNLDWSSIFTINIFLLNPRGIVDISG